MAKLSKQEIEEILNGIDWDDDDTVEDDYDFESSERSEVRQTTQQIAVPKEAVWAAGAAGLAIVVTAWPALILGVIVGGLIVGKIGCPTFTNKEK